MWYLSNLMEHGSLDGNRVETISIDTLSHTTTLFFHCCIQFVQLDDVQNSVHQLFVNTTRAMFADGAIRLDDIWAGIYSPLSYWNPDEVPGT